VVGVAAAELHAPATTAAAMARAPMRRIPFINVVSPLVWALELLRPLEFPLAESRPPFNALLVVC
jgi:hypothetical protein